MKDDTNKIEKNVKKCTNCENIEPMEKKQTLCKECIMVINGADDCM